MAFQNALPRGPRGWLRLRPRTMGELFLELKGRETCYFTSYDNTWKTSAGGDMGNRQGITSPRQEQNHERIRLPFCPDRLNSTRDIP